MISCMLGLEVNVWTYLGEYLKWDGCGDFLITAWPIWFGSLPPLGTHYIYGGS